MIRHEYRFVKSFLDSDQSYFKVNQQTGVQKGHSSSAEFLVHNYRLYLLRVMPYSTRASTFVRFSSYLL